MPSKYWLVILAVICVILLGIEGVSDSGGPLRFVANYTIIPMQKGISYAVSCPLITQGCGRNSMNWRDCGNFISWMKTMRIIRRPPHM